MTQSPRSWADFLRIRPFVRPYLWALGAMMSISLVGSTLGLTQPYLSKYLVDTALGHRDRHALLLAGFLMFAATVVGSALSYVSGLGYMRLSTSMLFDMRLEVYRHLHTLSPRFYSRSKLGDLVSRLNGDVAEVQRISADSFLTSLSNLLFIGGSLLMMILLSWKLFFFGVALIPISIALFSFFQTRTNKLARELREESASIGALFVETLIGIRLVACLNGSDHELDRFRARNASFVACLMRFQTMSLLGRSVPGVIITAATIVVFLYGGEEIIAGRMTIGTLVAFMAYHARLLSPVQNLMGLSSSLASAKVSLGRVLELLDTPAEVKEHPEAVAVSRPLRSIEFRHVTLRHDGRTVLDDVCCDIPMNCFSVIVGPSGGGKSTFADLLIRLLDPDAGTVLLNGRDLKTFSLRSLRENVMLIDQSPHLLHASLLENIAYAKPGVSRQVLEEAAHAAGLGDLLQRLPHGLDTVAGERGLSLSAGERQRVAIARAFLSDPQVIILDEPSAALDAACEEDLIATLRSRFRGKTLIAISHKPKLALAADYVLRLEGGRILAPQAVA